MIPATETLEAALKAWYYFLRERGVHPGRYDQKTSASDDAYQAILDRFRAFSDQHSTGREYLHTVLVALAKGTRLVKAALEWEEASAGSKATRSRILTSRARGEQWRLVMAYGGLETVGKALLCLRCKTKGLGLADATAFHASFRCGLPAYTPLVAPDRCRAELARWLKTEAPLDERQSPIIAFLKMQDDGTSFFYRWAVKGQSVGSWPAAIQLAKELRNATAHGSLSATKVGQWGLRDALDTLCMNLGELTAGALRGLVEGLPTA